MLVLCKTYNFSSVVNDLELFLSKKFVYPNIPFGESYIWLMLLYISKEMYSSFHIEKSKSLILLICHSVFAILNWTHLWYLLQTGPSVYFKSWPRSGSTDLAVAQQFIGRTDLAASVYWLQYILVLKFSSCCCGVLIRAMLWWRHLELSTGGSPVPTVPTPP